jgi:hypothetical protein
MLIEEEQAEEEGERLCIDQSPKQYCYTFYYYCGEYVRCLIQAAVSWFKHQAYPERSVLAPSRYPVS